MISIQEDEMHVFENVVFFMSAILSWGRRGAHKYANIVLTLWCGEMLEICHWLHFKQITKEDITGTPTLGVLPLTHWPLENLNKI